jgi:feruloyl esterase
MNRYRLLVPLVVFFAASAMAQNQCAKLRTLSLPETSMTTIEYVPAGPYATPSPFPNAPAPKNQPSIALPAYCRVAMVLTPSKDSHIESEVWLPAENWNGKLQVVGNGGWAGSISYSAMAAALKEGYATASTDTGHKPNEAGGNGMFALGHPEKLVDFGYRALHETTVKAKAMIAALYNSGPKLSYYNGCSTGGRQGLMEVTRYPEDFDGAVVGAPANPHIYLHAADVERNMRLRRDPGHVLTQAKVATLHRAVLDACDALDGARDGLIGNPEKCKFDPASLLCKGPDSDSCLTASQVEAAKIVYGDIKTRKGETIWTGFPFGGELQYSSLAEKIDSNAPPSTFPLDSIRILAYQDPNWDWRTWDLDRDVALAKEKSGFIDVHTRDLNAFKARGGKLLLYHGWADPGIAAGNTVNIYKGVLSKMGEKQDDWLRLFMIPGMGHCSGGPGTDQFNRMAVLERWREAGAAPDQIPASHVTGGTVDMTRPLCPYPKVATYKGSGSMNDAENFVCK